MGNYAIIKNNEVENVIVLNENQIEEFKNIYNADEIIDATPYNLCIGDIKIDNQWNRDLDGVYTILEEIIPQQQTDYHNLKNKINYQTNLLKTAEEALIEGVESIE